MPRKRKQIVQLLQQTVALRTPVLDLSNGTVDDLLEQVCQMNWLTDLNLSHSHIHHLPDSVGNLITLTRLDLSENQLVTLPESFTQLTALAYLNLSHAGNEFSLSPTLTDWLKGISEVVWTTDPPVVLPPDAYVYWSPDHPNRWLERIQDALKLYGDAFNMEERGYDGTDSRTKADTDIQQVFDQVAELGQLFSEFYEDFRQHRFYYSSSESEKMIKNNPFRLPTKADEAWLATATATDVLPAHLQGKPWESTRTIEVINTQTGQPSAVCAYEFGEISAVNRADCEAQLFQAGPERLYVRTTRYSEGDIADNEWFDSENGGQFWQKQPQLTYTWLATNCHNWRDLGSLDQRPINAFCK